MSKDKVQELFNDLYPNFTHAMRHPEAKALIAAALATLRGLLLIEETR
mgnify:CR=1 FL=1